MARRAALIALVCGLVSCGSNGGGSWSCHWQCHSNESSGTVTYPSGTSNPTQQCTTDKGSGCNDFECGCNQN